MALKLRAREGGKRDATAASARAPLTPRAVLRRWPWLVALVAVPLVGLTVLALRGDDVAPDSVFGYACAIAGTFLLALVGAGYALRKRLRRNWSGLLHTALAWHVVGGFVALVLILLHAAGNFHPRTGTYALCSLVALVVSGIIGKQIDRLAPRFAARASLKTLTDDGEERLDTLMSTLYLQPHARQGADVPGVADVPDAATAEWLASASAEIRRALGAERFYLHLVRVWRWLHTALSVLTLVLIVWHIAYAITLLLGQ